jgi:hypothetical protein
MRQAHTEVHLTIEDHEKERWSSLSTVVVRCAQCVPCLSTEEMSVCA